MILPFVRLALWLMVGATFAVIGLVGTAFAVGWALLRAVGIV